MVQRQSRRQLAEAGDWTHTPVSGCKMRSWVPSSPLLWSPPSPSQGMEIPPCRYATPHPRNFVFLTQTTNAAPFAPWLGKAGGRRCSIAD